MKFCVLVIIMKFICLKKFLKLRKKDFEWWNVIRNRVRISGFFEVMVLRNLIYDMLKYLKKVFGVCVLEVGFEDYDMMVSVWVFLEEFFFFCENWKVCFCRYWFLMSF